jgi:hypothetical protein
LYTIQDLPRARASNSNPSAHQLQRASSRFLHVPVRVVIDVVNNISQPAQYFGRTTALIMR